jgi:predicted deacylase
MKPEQPYGDDRGHNMNRWWPGKRSGNDTARIPFAVYQAFGDQATHALDLHCWQKYAAPAVLVRDAPGVRELAGKLGHRFVDVRPPSDHTLGGYFSATGRIGVTYEFSGQYAVDEKQVRRGLRLITNMARTIGLLPGRPLRGDDPVLFSDQCATREVKAPCSGLFVAAPGLELCQPVEKGVLLGHILSDANLNRREIRSPAAGFLRAHGASRANCDVAMPGHHPYVTRGERLAVIACESKA